MARPDFGEVRALIKKLRDLDELSQGLSEKTGQLEESVRGSCLLLQEQKASVLLKDISADKLKEARSGIRTSLLEEAGFRTLYDLYEASDEALRSVSGVGEKQVAAIRVLTGEFLRSLAGRERITLSADETDVRSRTLITAIARYRRAETVMRDAGRTLKELHERIETGIANIKILNGFHWVFSMPRTREQTLAGIGELRALCGSADFSKAERFISLFVDAVGTGDEEALNDFRKNSAPYYALIEKMTGPGTARELTYGSVNAQLAAQVSETDVDLSLFRGDLRAYQLFGVQYILQQKKVLLGDEMGLGKTVQAIAAMAHLQAEDPGALFLVICPASVMINWCREISKFSDIRPRLLHGSHIDSMFESWVSEGQAAVTNYESMGKIIRRIDGSLNLKLLVIDEAHYIKNPEAQRTRYIRRLEDEAERILLMTGTPLENNVDEMCELIGFLRPDMAKKVRSQAGLHHIEAFREMLAPVYLRRRVEQVLTELPPLTESEEWVRMTPQDEAFYGQALAEGNFMAMRRVSFLQDDMAGSAKAQRLRELVEEACREGRKVVVYSYFRETVKKAAAVLGDLCSGMLTGSTPAVERQAVIDRFGDGPEGRVLICQIQAGGTGLNIQAASTLVFCEPQIKPSLTRQAVARVYRMGQSRNVLVCHLLCDDTVDEAIELLLREKQAEFDRYADESSMADAVMELVDREWVREVIEQERRKYLPAVIPGQAAVQKD